MFDHLTAEKFTFKLRATEQINLPVYKGAAFRGGFGVALKEVSCALKRQKCDACLLGDRCVYLYLFETPPPQDSEMMRLYPSVPHPFVIEPPLEDSRVANKGEFLEFGLVLVGRALEYLAYFIYAFVVLGENGLGRGKGKFELEEVSVASVNGSVTLYSSSDKVLRQPARVNQAEAVRAKIAGFGDGW